MSGPVGGHASVQTWRSISYQATPAGPARPTGGKTHNKPHSKAGTDMENQPAGRHQIMTLSRYGRVDSLPHERLGTVSTRRVVRATRRGRPPAKGCRGFSYSTDFLEEAQSTLLGVARIDDSMSVEPDSTKQNAPG